MLFTLLYNRWFLFHWNYNNTSYNTIEFNFISRLFFLCFVRGWNVQLKMPILLHKSWQVLHLTASWNSHHFDHSMFESKLATFFFSHSVIFNPWLNCQGITFEFTEKWFCKKKIKDIFIERENVCKALRITSKSALDIIKWNRHKIKAKKKRKKTRNLCLIPSEKKNDKNR